MSIGKPFTEIEHTEARIRELSASISNAQAEHARAVSLLEAAKTERDRLEKKLQKLKGKK